MNWRTPVLKTVAMAAVNVAIAIFAADQARLAPEPPRDGGALGPLQRVEQLIGREVRNNRDQRIGTVRDAILDSDSGRVLYVVISAGGFLGVADRLVAVPPGALSEPSGQWRIDADKQKLLDAPQYLDAADQWTNMRSRKFVSGVYQFFEQPGWWSGGNSSETFPRAHKAGELKGAEVAGGSGEKIGAVETVLLKLSAGRVVFVVLSLNGDLAAVPPGALTPAGGRKWVANIDREKLARAPRFSPDRWPDFSDPAFASQIYRYYGKPAWFELQPTSEERDKPSERIYHEPDELK